MKYVFLLINDSKYNLFEKNDVGTISENTNLNQGTHLVKVLRTNKEVELQSTDFRMFKIDQTGDRFTHKVCDRCFKILSTEDEFENNRLKKGDVITKRPSCRACRKIKNGVNIPSSIKARWEQTRPKDYTPFTCPICNKTTIAGISKVVLDHDHSSGKVRGWLCESCNTGIGRFDDDLTIVNRAIDWLSKKI